MNDRSTEAPPNLKDNDFGWMEAAPAAAAGGGGGRPTETTDGDFGTMEAAGGGMETPGGDEAHADPGSMPDADGSQRTSLLVSIFCSSELLL